MLAADDTRHYKALDAQQAHEQGLIDQKTLRGLLQLKQRRLKQRELDDLRPKYDHLLISFDQEGTLLRDADGTPDIRLCNFELVRTLRARKPQAPRRRSKPGGR